MKKSKVLIIVSIILIFIVSFVGAKGEVIENLEIPVGVGEDIEEDSPYVSYIISALIHSFEGDDKITNVVLTGKSSTLGGTRENRQLKASRIFLLGLNRVFIFSEQSAKYGIRDVMDINLNNPDLNDRAVCVVCKGKAQDILKYKVKGYSSSAQYVEGMVKNLEQYNFFPQQYTVMDIMVRLDAEGRNLLLPYIEMKDEGIQTTGLAVFSKDKMIGKTDIREAKIINLLKENNGKGMLTIQQSSKNYINYYANSKRKVRCYMENGKCRFVIDVKLTGSIISNEFYNNMYTDPEKIRNFEKDIEKSTEELCNDTISKIKNNYKIDVLDLGRVAAAKYGRDKNINWDDVVSESDIQVKVHAKVNTEGRGDY